MGCMALPAFHTLGVYMQLLNPLYGAVSIAVYPPTATEKHLLPVIPSPSNILEHTRRTKANSIIIIPTLLQIWAQSLDAVEFLKTLEYVVSVFLSSQPLFVTNRKRLAGLLWRIASAQVGRSPRRIGRKTPPDIRRDGVRRCDLSACGERRRKGLAVHAIPRQSECQVGPSG